MLFVGWLKGSDQPLTKSLEGKMITPIAQATPPAVRIFSPSDSLPPALAGMDRETLFAHIDAAKRLIQAHQDTARNGNPEAEHYYFYIPEVARDMGNARYTQTIMFAELRQRDAAEGRKDH
jgi:hypothetical protein